MQEQIDKYNPFPLYWQLAELIKKQIASGELHPGDKIPTEHWLSETYQLSRVTVRRAVQFLIDNGTLNRNRGESPTVAYPRMVRQQNRLTGLSEDLRRMGHVPSSLILCCEKTTVPLDVADFLKLEIGAPVFHLMRLRLADDSPLAIHDCYYPLSVCGKALTTTFHADSVYHLLDDNGIKLAYATQTVSARNATDKEASLLSMPPNSALLHVMRTSFTAEGVPVEFSDMLYNPTRYDFRMDLNR